MKIITIFCSIINAYANNNRPNDFYFNSEAFIGNGKINDKLTLNLLETDSSKSVQNIDTTERSRTDFDTQELSEVSFSSNFLNQNNIQYHGTTTIAFIYKNRIIMCIDSKASIGDYVGSRTVKKVIIFPLPLFATFPLHQIISALNKTKL
jgi:hypothetical protein